MTAFAIVLAGEVKNAPHPSHPAHPDHPSHPPNGSQARVARGDGAQEVEWRVEVAPSMSDQARRFFDLMTAAGVPTSF
jgi:hypothetical protein